MSDTPLSQTLAKILAAPRPARPWRDGEKIPWHDPELSGRLLAVHLDPETHLASRAPELIEQHVNWLRTLASGHFPEEQSPRLLDLGCGPGLYCQALARVGWQTVGVDFSPASIAYANRQAAEEGLLCHYLERDLLSLEAEELEAHGPFDLATFLFGELNAFRPEHAALILATAAELLAPGGLLIIEPQPWDLFTRENWTEWQACEASLWSDQPHLWLQEHIWDQELKAEIIVHWVIDGETGHVRRHAQCHQAYEPPELEQLLKTAGFDLLREYPPVSGSAPEVEFPLLVGRRSS